MKKKNSKLGQNFQTSFSYAINNLYGNQYYCYNNCLRATSAIITMKCDHRREKIKQSYNFLPLSSVKKCKKFYTRRKESSPDAPYFSNLIS